MKTILSFIAFLLLQIVVFAQPSTSPIKIYSREEVDKPAEFPGGIDYLRSYLDKHTHYPAAAKAGAQGLVLVDFVVGVDGSISNLKITRELEGEAGRFCNEEALRVVKNLPPFKPGILNGVAVPSYTSVAVSFHLPDEERFWYVLDTMPTFGTTNNAVIEYLDKNTHYPKEAESFQIHGYIHVRFIVERDGTLSNIHLVEDSFKTTRAGMSCNAEALRVVREMPKWKPAIKNKKPVRCQYLVYVKFIPKKLPQHETSSSGWPRETVVDLYSDDNIAVPELPEEPDSSTILSVVEEMPQFPGGESALSAYFKKNLKYPVMAKNVTLQGTIYVTFVVNEDGSITNPQIMRGIQGPGDKECATEAIRLISTMPKWQPGRQDGKAVKVQNILPVKFTLQ